VSGVENETRTWTVHRGSGDSMHDKDRCATREVLRGVPAALAQRQAREGQMAATEDGGWARSSVDSG